jgi:hypothetical protein
MKQTPPLKKIKAMFLVLRTIILETKGYKRPISWIFHKPEAFICPDNGILQADKFPLRYNPAETGSSLCYDKQPVSSIQHDSNLAY